MNRRTRSPGASVQPDAAIHLDDHEPEETCSIDAVIARYPGQWIVLRVTGYGEDRRPAEGQIAARAHSYAEASRLLTECLIRASPAGGRYHLLRAQRHLPPGDQLRQSVSELIAQGDPPGRWPGLR